jgi:hypothetical protein
MAAAFQLARARDNRELQGVADFHGFEADDFIGMDDGGGVHAAILGERAAKRKAA